MGSVPGMVKVPAVYKCTVTTRLWERARHCTPPERNLLVSECWHGWSWSLAVPYLPLNLFLPRHKLTKPCWHAHCIPRHCAKVREPATSLPLGLDTVCLNLFPSDSHFPSWSLEACSAPLGISDDPSDRCSGSLKVS